MVNYGFVWACNLHFWALFPGDQIIIGEAMAWLLEEVGNLFIADSPSPLSLRSLCLDNGQVLLPAALILHVFGQHQVPEHYVEKLPVDPRAGILT